jgi:opacity protein-like surface antigen
MGFTLPTGSALRQPYAIGPEAQLGLSWLSPQQTWLLRGAGTFAYLANRPEADQLSQHQIWQVSLSGGPGLSLSQQWQLHLPIGIGYAWARDDLRLSDGDMVNYLTAEGLTGQAGLCATWLHRWTLDLTYRHFQPYIVLGETTRQQLIMRGGLYDLFVIPSQRFAMHRLSLRVGLRW